MLCQSAATYGVTRQLGGCQIYRSASASRASRRHVVLMAASDMKPLVKFDRRTHPDRGGNFRTILACDGGGLRGITSAALIEGVEDAIKFVAKERNLTPRDAAGKPVELDWDSDFDIQPADYFDVCAGTSTGAIIATYVASKGSQASVLHALPTFQQGVADSERVKAAVGPDAAAAAAAVKQINNNEKPTPGVKLPNFGTAAAAQALFMSQGPSIFPDRNRFPAKWPFSDKLNDVVNKLHDLAWPKYPAIYDAEDEKKNKVKKGVEVVLRNAFGEDEVLMSGEGVLHTSLLVTSYQIDYDRPILMYHSAKDEAFGRLGGSGYAALRRSMREEELDLAKKGHHRLLDALARKPQAGSLAMPSAPKTGMSDLVNVPAQEFSLWQVVRASTAAPTFFPTADVKNWNKKPDSDDLDKYQMTDGGVVANNPSMAAVAFAATRYSTKFVAKPGSKKPSLAVLSLGCGTSSELSGVKKDAGGIGWITGPIIDILQGGAGELSAALNQHMAKDWPGGVEDQFLRIQLTAGSNKKGNETLTYSGEEVPLTADNQHAAPFNAALGLGVKDPLRANTVLSSMDVVGNRWALCGLGHAMAQDTDVVEKLRSWVRNFVLADS